jgi:ADP-ribosylglycohydrolase
VNLSPHPPTNASAVVGAILGTAAGDALGVPYEGLSARRGLLLLGEPTRHRFLLGRGMVSDDTEHTCIVAQSLAASAGDPAAFTRDFARRLRWWLPSLSAGIGRATLRATLRLWLGYSPEQSGVFSAGNGPAMRSAVLGAAVADPDRLREIVRLSTRVTHTDPKAEYGAHAVALAARLGVEVQPVAGSAYLARLREALPGGAAELVALLERAAASADRGEVTQEFAQSQGWGRGVSGYVYQTVPAAIHAWLRHPRDFAAAVTGVVRCGGDADTTGAIVGGIVGAAVGKEGIPAAWLDGLFEWPRTVRYMEALGRHVADALAHSRPRRAPRPLGVGLLVRNLFFLAAVLAHVGRRALPPY